MDAESFDEQAFTAEYSSIAKGNKPELPGNGVRILEQIDSTNSELMRQVSGAGILRGSDGSLTPDGKKLHKSLIAAAFQTAGRGRLGRTFYSPKNDGIYFSLCYVPQGGVQNPALFTAGAAVGVCRAIKSLYGIEPQLKWVNDVFINGRKVCGILTEGVCQTEIQKVEAAIVGIGINLRVSDIQDGEVKSLMSRAGGIEDEGGSQKIGRIRLLARTVCEVLSIYESGENIIDEYRKSSMLTGKLLTVTPVIGDDRTAFKATALSITDDAGLLVQTEDGSTRVLHTGEVTLH